jgi:hypothetical protein
MNEEILIIGAGGLAKELLFAFPELEDLFIFYDDVTFIKGGWINRNNILINQQKKLFTIPVDKLSSNKLICDTFVNSQLYYKWEKKFLRTLEQSYKKAPYFDYTFKLVKDVLAISNENISQLALKSVISISRYLGMKIKFEVSSQIFRNSRHLSAQDRVIDMVKKRKGNNYINAIGGKELYIKDDFKKENIDLFLLKASLPEYRQLSSQFISGLSIIDVLMMNSKEEVIKMLNESTLE